MRTTRVAKGWLELPSGPREVILQRALVLRRGAGESGYSPDRLMHRWIDPHAGVVHLDAKGKMPARPVPRLRYVTGA